MLIKAKAGPESEQYGLFEEASATLVYFQIEVGFCTANTAAELGVCTTLLSIALTLQLLIVVC